MENIVDYRRFGLVLKREVLGNWRSLLLNVLVVYGILLAGLLISMASVYTTGSRVPYHEVSSAFTGWYFFVFYFGAAYQASRIFRPCADKRGCIAMLMLPATNCEKFLSRVILVTVGFFMMLTIALLAISATYSALTLLMGLDDSWYGFLFADGLWAFVPEVVYAPHEFSWGPFYGFSVLMWIYSVFVFSGALWRKHPFPKAVGVLVAVFVAGVLVFVLSVSDFKTLKHISVDVIEAWMAGLGVFWMLWAVVNWIFAYRRFARMQIVEPKRGRR